MSEKVITAQCETNTIIIMLYLVVKGIQLDRKLYEIKRHFKASHFSSVSEWHSLLEHQLEC